MISPSYDIHQFNEAVQGKDWLDTVHLAEQEAMKAWQRTYRESIIVDHDMRAGIIYQHKLLRLIDFIRNDIPHTDLSDDDYKEFHLVQVQQ